MGVPLQEDKTIGRIIGWAESHENVRAVRLVGSRANPDGAVDELSDYDIEVLVHERSPFVEDTAWPEHFGEIAVRWPLTPGPTSSAEWITQLVQYRDGLRIDFQITDRDSAFAETGEDAWLLLLDKESGWVFDADAASPGEGTSGGGAHAAGRGTAPHAERPIRGPSLHVDEPPTLEEAVDRINAFWWDVLYVGKALCRGELNLARFMLEAVIRFEMITPLLRWYAAALAGEPINTGLAGRRLHEHLPESVWEHYVRTFAGADEEDLWRSVFELGELVGRIGTDLVVRLTSGTPSDRQTELSRDGVKWTGDSPHEASSNGFDAEVGYPAHTDEAVSALLGELYELWRGSG